MEDHTGETAALLRFLSSYKHYYILSHVEPDGDCVGASLALESFLTRRGKTVTLLNEGPFDRPEIQDFAQRFRTALPTQSSLDGCAAVVLDCSDYERLGSLSSLPRRLPAAVVDHHATNDTSGEFVLIDPTAPSTTVLIQLIIETAEGSLTPEEARHALFGLCTDTGYFRHLDRDGGDALRSAARLVDAGASPREVHDAIFGGQPLASRSLLARWLQRVEPVAGGRALLTYQTLRDSQEFAPSERDTGMLYQLLLGVRGCRVVAFVRQENQTECSGSLRSTNDFDVSAIAQLYGGGGHKRAAGFLTDRPAGEVYAELRELIESRLAEFDAGR